MKIRNARMDDLDGIIENTKIDNGKRNWRGLI